MRAISFLVALILVLAPAAFAADTAGNAIFVPVVSRTPGALGSEWRTDLVISNVSRRSVTVPFTVTFTPNDGSPGTSMHGEIGPRTSRTFTDVVNIGFGRAVAAGVVHVTSSSPDARLTARARIYNVASVNGEFGQHVPGARVSDLQREHHLNGLTGVDGNRTNVGISNPWNTEISFWISVFKDEGDLQFAAGWWTLAPRQVLQINDVFAWIGKAPFANATIEITTSQPAFVYASVVRADSGDPIFVPAVTPGAELSGGVIQPQCTAPAPLYIADNPAEGWIVVFQDDTNAAASASLLAQKYGFTVRSVYEAAFRGFVSADVSQTAIAGLRCEPVVKFIEQNRNVPLP
jgi:hypothetical protein